MKIRVIVRANEFPEIAKRLPDAAAQVVNQNLIEAVETARRLVPVDTGALQASIDARMTGRTTGSITADTPYSAYVEYGTRYMKAQPFLRPAIEQQRRQYEADMAKLEARLR